MVFKYMPHGQRPFSKMRRAIRWLTSLFVAIAFIGGLRYLFKRR